MNTRLHAFFHFARLRIQREGEEIRKKQEPETSNLSVNKKKKKKRGQVKG